MLFRIDPAPFQYKVNQLEASLAQTRQQVKQLKASYERATANVDGLRHRPRRQTSLLHLKLGRRRYSFPEQYVGLWCALRGHSSLLQLQGVADVDNEAGDIRAQGCLAVSCQRPLLRDGGTPGIMGAGLRFSGT
ncbi:hypothetical protein E3H11_03015 [Bradyrhizobium brasilense]|nr:hypothetical protein [Bradyrhizobium brasilense]